MSVLAFDTSQRGHAVVLRATEAGNLEDSVVSDGRTTLENLHAAVSRLAASSLTAVVAVIGPGSYTGVRIGVAAALGVAQARELPLYGISSFAVAAMASPASPFRAVVDAGRGRVYLAEGARDGGTLVLQPARHLELAELEPDHTILTIQELEIAGTIRGGAVQCLAAAISGALRGEPLRLNEIRALHVPNQDV